MLDTFFVGFGVSISLILAIGAQNAFVLRQGILRQHVGLVVTICAVTDAILIGAGVAGLGWITEKLPWLTTTLLAVTWLNPHMYLDTVVLIGSVSTQYPGQEMIFWIGAAVASASFFVTLGYGARILAPLFSNPIAWKVLDLIVGCIMWAIAFSLISGA